MNRRFVKPILSLGLLWLAIQGNSQESNPRISDQADAAAYLSAFKQKAIDAAFESGARVKGLAYIDQEGRLHERTMFSSEADVKGVQISSYLEAMGGEEQLQAVQVSEDARCQLWTGSGTTSALVSVRIDSKTSLQRSERAIASEQERVLGETIVRALKVRGFRVGSIVGQKPPSYQDTTYSRALVGDWADGPAPDFLFSLSVAELVDEEERSELYLNHPGLASIVGGVSRTIESAVKATKLPGINLSQQSKKFVAAVSINQPSTDRQFEESHAYIETSAHRSVNSGQWILKQNTKKLDSWAAKIVAKFVADTNCIPRLFTVTREGPNLFSIDAGYSRGVRSGAWLLVGAKDLMVDNIVSDVTLDNLVMLKVTQVDEYRALAQLLPGGKGALTSTDDLLGTLP